MFVFFCQSHREFDRVGSGVLAHVELLFVFVLDFEFAPQQTGTPPCTIVETLDIGLIPLFEGG